MQPSTGRSGSATIPLLLALTLALAAGCSDSTSPTGTRTGAPGRGSFQVSLTTSGVDLDPDGFVVVVDSSTTGSFVGVNETISVTGVAPGTHMVRLEGVAANCVPRGGVAQVSVGLGEGGSPSVAFTVSCFTRSIPATLASTQLLFVRGGQIYRTRADGTGLVAVGSGYFPTWSPNGQRIAFARGEDNVYVMDVDGANVQHVAGNLASYTSIASAPTWSPDGRRLALFSGDGWGDIEITVVPLDGATPPILIPGWLPAWSPDGSRITFFFGAAQWTVSSDGSNPTKLTDYSGPGGDAAWSPDGKQIAFADSRGISVVNADGSGLRQLTSIPGFHPAWSPDGQAIAFDTGCAWVGCSPAVFYVTVDGSATGLLIENGYTPSWHK